MTEKPNSVCRWCHQEIIQLYNVWISKAWTAGSTRYCDFGRVHEPVAEPTEANGEPLLTYAETKEQLDATTVTYRSVAEPAEPSVHVHTKSCYECGHDDCPCHGGYLHEQPMCIPAVAGEGPRCRWPGCSEIESHRIHHGTREEFGGHTFVPEFAEGTPKLEEIATTIQRKVWELWQQSRKSSRTSFGQASYQGFVREEVTAILRPFITPACSPPEIKVYAAYDFIGKKKEPKFREFRATIGTEDFPLTFGFLRISELPILENLLRKAATPASTGEAAECSDEAIELLSAIENADYEEGCAAVFELRKLLPNLDRYVKDEVEEQIEKMSTGEANGWISASTTLPVPLLSEFEGRFSRTLELFDSANNNWHGFYDFKDRKWWIHQGYEDDAEVQPIYKITHWRELPPAPTSVPQAEPPK